MSFVFPLVSLMVLALSWGLGRVAAGTGAGPRVLRGLILVAGPLWLATVCLKVAGPMAWFRLPEWCFLPVMNWVVAGIWALFVPIRNMHHMVKGLRENRRLNSESRAVPECFVRWLEARGYPEAALLAGFRLPPRVALHPELDQPRALGLLDALSWREVILVPASWVPASLLDESPYWSTFGLVSREVEPRGEAGLFMVLLHELGHLHGGDTFAGFLALVGSLVVPLEWQPMSAEPLPAARVRRALWQLGKAYRHFLGADLQGREWMADEFAASVFPGAHHLLLEERGGAQNPPPVRRSRVSVAAGILGWVLIVPLVAMFTPGAAPLLRGLGGSGIIKGSAPAGWEVLIWQAPGRPVRPSSAYWGYLPATRATKPRVRLGQKDSDHVLVFTSSFQLSSALKGPASVRITWEFVLEKGDPAQAFDLQLVANQIGEEETRGVFLPFRPRLQEGLQRLSMNRFRMTKELPIPRGLNVDVIHCYWAIAKPLEVLMDPPAVTARGADGVDHSLDADR